MLTNINSLEELQNEQIRLKLEIAKSEVKLQEDFNWIVRGLHPIKIISKSLSNLTDLSENSLVSDGIGIGISMLASKLIPKSSWIMKLILPGILKRLTSNIVENHKLEILIALKKMSNNFKNHGSSRLYDSSTSHVSY